MQPDRWGLSASEFQWAVGIENTFIPQTRAGHRRLDEYELMDHYGQWREDLDRAADLGITAIRYGIPWYRVNPRPGAFDWSWTDPVLEHLVQVRGIAPIIDLLHYGTPTWLDNNFVNASYPRRVAEFAAAFAERYRGLVRCYTPINELGVTAHYCGRDGRWPPYLAGEDGYVKLLVALAKGMVCTAEAIRAVQPDAALVHVEDIGLERAGAPDLAEHAAAAQDHRLLPLDLACGRVAPGHVAHRWLLDHGATEAELDEIATRSPRWDVLGVNYYPWSNHLHARRRNGRTARVIDPSADDLDLVLRMVARRYRLPLMVTETSSPGPHFERTRWMADTLRAVRRARAAGVPVLGYTWFPLFSMIEWKYRWSRKGLEHHLLHLGLWDVARRSGRMERDSTPLIDAYREYVSDPRASVGEWAPETESPGSAGRVA